MEVVPSKKLEHLLPDTRSRPGAVTPRPDAVADPFQHHLRPNAPQPTSTAPTPKESPEADDMAASPASASPQETEQKLSASDGDDVRTENSAGQPTSATAGTKINESAGPVDQQSAAAEFGQDGENLEDAEAAANHVKGGGQPASEATSRFGDQQDESAPTGEQGPHVADGDRVQPDAESTSAKRPGQRQASHPPTTGQKPAGSDPGSLSRAAADLRADGQRAAEEAWIELPESSRTENLSAAPGCRPGPPAAAPTVAQDSPIAPGHPRMRDLPASRRTDGQRGTEPFSRVEQARFVQRVGGAIQAAQVRGGPLQLRLSPPELGSLRLEVTVDKGVLSAKVQVDSQMARAVLLDNLPLLRDRLLEQGVQLEHFDVDVTEQPPDDARHHAGDTRDPVDCATEKPATEQAATESSESTCDDRSTPSEGKLNVVI
jgi:flagellar hook-length control protein FliK